MCTAGAAAAAAAADAVHGWEACVSLGLVKLYAVGNPFTVDHSYHEFSDGQIQVSLGRPHVISSVLLTSSTNGSIVLMS